MKLAVSGKGGVGKTTIAGTLARLYATEGRRVLAIDVSELQKAEAGVTCMSLVFNGSPMRA